MAYLVMACIVMAYLGMACIVMAYIGMAYVVMAALGREVDPVQERQGAAAGVPRRPEIPQVLYAP